MDIKRIIKLLYFRAKYASKKVAFGKGCNISISATFEGANSIGRNSLFKGILGFGSYVGQNVCLSANIGKYCSIADSVKTLTGTHPLSKFVSTSPMFYSLLKQSNLTFVNKQFLNEYLYADKVNELGIIVENDVWIGTGATIMGGLIIGNGAVILPNATVIKDVPPYAIVGGIPAKVIKMRFDDNTINFLLQFKWWNQPVEWLQKNVLFFHDVENFKNNFNNF